MSDNEYTPSMEQIEDGYAHDPESEYRDPVNYGSTVAANRRAFRRALEAHDRTVAAKAWGEGLHVAYNHVGRLEDADAAGQGVTIPDPVNPYRAALGVPVGTEKEADRG